MNLADSSQKERTATMDKANLERLRILLQGHEELLEEKRSRPEGVLRQNDAFQRAVQPRRALGNHAHPGDDQGRDGGQVESASIFHSSTAAGLKVKLDRWEDYERSLLFSAMTPPKW